MIMRFEISLKPNKANQGFVDCYIHFKNLLSN
jgi:hypothetical protein